MATTIGSIQEFDPDTEAITAYLERVQLFMMANAVKDDKKVAVLLSVIGSKAYGLLRNLLEPERPSEKDLDDLVTVLKQHFEPKPIVVAERFRFYRRMQAPGESFASYIAELKSLTRNCAFEGLLEEALRDQLVCGMRSLSIQKHLWREADLTFKQAMEIALSAEAADRHSNQLAQGSSTVINKFSDSKSPKGFVQQTHATATAKSKPVNRVSACHRCGSTDHVGKNCKFQQTVCHKCGKKGHLARVCRSSKPTTALRQSRQQYVAEEESPEIPLFRLEHPKVEPITVKVLINGVSVPMKVDTGAAVSVMTAAQQKKLFPSAQLSPSSVILRTYTTERLQIHGEMSAEVQYNKQSFNLPLLIVDGEGPALLGRDWLTHIRRDWAQLAYTSSSPRLPTLLDSFQDVFKDELGTVKGIKVSLATKPNIKPKFYCPRPVPLALKDAVGSEIDRLEKEGIIEKVDHSEWATPIVPVPKKDGTIRICGDYKVTINAALDIDQYPLPKAEEIFASLAGGQKFTKLDLSQAYQQLLLDDDSKALLTVNTHKGLYRYTRLPFGIASAPAIFQRTMDVILQGIAHVMYYIDDIIITGKDDNEHLSTLVTVLERLQEHGFRLKKSKCTFMGDSVEYLGHQIDAQGLHPTKDKLSAIRDAPAPPNITELRSFLGLLNYYGKFIQNLSTLIHPLNHLLQKDVPYSWSEVHENAFLEAKQALMSTTVLAHYDPHLPIFLAADASAYGVGAVISHQYPDGTERPIAFASRTLTASEENYAQLEKEALALIFGVKKFHQYLYGRMFHLVTDHKPLTTILHPSKCTPPLAAARLQRWSLILSAYQYQIEFKSTSQHSNADGLSHLPLSHTAGEDPDIVAATCFNMAQIASLPVTAQMIASATRTDPVLSKVITYIREGWPCTIDETLSPFRRRATELTVEGDCVLWGTRVIVPAKFHDTVLKELHLGHPGISHTKALARSYIWWPGLASDIKRMVKACRDCQSVNSSPPAAPVHQWIWPSRPWERIHADFAGPFQQKMYLLIIDAHSKWPEICQQKPLKFFETCLADMVSLNRS